MNNMKYTDVYVAAIPQQTSIGRVHCAERQAYIERGKNEVARREKYYAWKLLEYALRHSLDIDIETLSFFHEPCGKWRADGCEFSLSHGDGVVAVAVSSAPVGVDVQRVLAPRHENFARRVLNEAEYAHYEGLCEEERLSYLSGAWTAKEALFKMRGEASFVPSQLEENADSITKTTVLINATSYVCAVATTAPFQTRFFFDVDLV